eukprot:1246234-Pyramimonas_sp.AAC.1
MIRSISSKVDDNCSLARVLGLSLMSGLARSLNFSESLCLSLPKAFFTAGLFSATLPRACKPLKQCLCKHLKPYL